MKTNVQFQFVLRFSLFISLLFFSTTSFGQAADIDQTRNGTDTLPLSPAQWVNGNLNANGAHFSEGMSIPYRATLTLLPIGTTIYLTLGYDIKHSSKHAIDYLTHYNRLLPHGFYFHFTPEIIDPLYQSTLPAGTPFTTYPVPVPSAVGTPVPNQPTNSYNALPIEQRLMTLYNGIIDSIYYDVQGSLTAAQSETRIIVKFRATAASAILAWGGHIASRWDWGSSNGGPNSAGGISGSPFHMRLIGWNLSNIGNQDRSLSGSAVFSPDVTLPVEVLYFKGNALKEKNNLVWVTASEINNDYFAVERSADGMGFENAGTVDAGGNSTDALNYSFDDVRPLEGINYYRLKQVDYNGAYKYSNTISVRSGMRNQFFVYPSGNGTYILQCSESADGIATVLSMDGRVIKTIRFSGKNAIEINLSDYSDGMYVLRLTGENFRQNFKLVKNQKRNSEF